MFHSLLKQSCNFLLLSGMLLIVLYTFTFLFQVEELLSTFLFFFFLRFYLLFFDRGREGERDENIDAREKGGWLPLIHALTDV